MKVEELITHYPLAYHMAETGTWESIQKHGLLSTVALLDLFEINGERREEIACKRRPESVEISHTKHGRAVIRDQKPMSESALQKCLDSGLTPREWYLILNQRVFFWLRDERLNGLLSARAYRSKQHCVLTVSTAELLAIHAERVSLCPINSGSTVYNPQPRGIGTFKRISDYPFDAWRKRRPVKNAVVELVVDYSVPDIAKFVTRAEERRGDKVLKTVFKKS